MCMYPTGREDMVLCSLAKYERSPASDLSRLQVPKINMNNVDLMSSPGVSPWQSGNYARHYYAKDLSPSAQAIT